MRARESTLPAHDELTVWDAVDGHAVAPYVRYLLLLVLLCMDP